jgi:hypothetical protein
MPEEKTDLQKEKTVTRPSIYSEIHNLSFGQIAAKKQEPVEQKVEENKKEESPNTEELEKKAQEIREKRREEKKKQLAEEISATVKETLKKERESLKEKESKEEEERLKKEELEKKKNYIPSWKRDPNAPKDDKGNPIPKSYDEIFEEAKNAAKNEIEAEFEERARLKDEEDSRAKELENQKTEQAKKNDEALSQLLEEEYQDLVSAGKLPKIKNESDPEDEGMKAKKDLFKTGMEYNQRRINEGKRPVTSIKVIYYENYSKEKEIEQPAGGDAPVAGGEPATPPSEELNVPYEQLHRMSYRDIVAKAKELVSKKSS